MTTKPNKVENCTKKKMDNNKDVRSSVRILHVCVCEYANVINLWSRRRRSRGGPAWNQRDACDYKHISFTINTWKEIPELHILLRRQVCHLRSHRTVKGGGKVHVLSQLCYHWATPGGKRRDFRRLTFSNMASYFPYANQLVLIQRWAKSSASCLASSEGSLDKPGDTRRFESLHKPTNLFFFNIRLFVNLNNLR